MTLFIHGCKTRANPPSASHSFLKVSKNGMYWEEKSAVATYNIQDSIVSIIGVQDTETFTIRFKYARSNQVITVEFLDAYALTSPFVGSAAIAVAFHLDASQPNKIHLRRSHLSRTRLVGNYDLYLKRASSFQEKGNKTARFQGSFDVKPVPMAAF